MIEVSNLTKRYRNRAVVDGVSFAVAPGRVTGFLGRNGAGKSTTMRMMLGLTRPDQGSATIGGRRYADLRYPIRQVGAVLESAAPHGSLTVAGHLSWVAQSNRIGGGRIAEVLELMDLTGAAKERVGALSLGMGQRLALASALLGDPDVLILDEPTNGLDAEGIRWLRELLRRMAADGKIVFLSSHLMTEMSLVADHLLVLHQGRIIADTSVADFVGKHARSYSRVRTPRAAQLIGEVAGTGGTPVLAADGSVEIGGMTTIEVRKLAEEKGIPLEELSVGYGSLEDAFLSVISGAGVDGKAGE